MNKVELEKYVPTSCKDCAWSYVSNLLGGVLACGLEGAEIKGDPDRVSSWCPITSDKKVLDE